MLRQSSDQPIEPTTDMPGSSLDESKELPIVVLLRTGIELPSTQEQKRDEVVDYNDQNYAIYAPAWVKNCLEKLSKELFKEKDKISFNIEKHYGHDVTTIKVEKYTIQYPLTLRDLQILARNEGSNSQGEINFERYQINAANTSPLGFTKKIVMNLKDLAKHCIIIGQTKARSFGGFPSGVAPTPLPDRPDVLICDLSALQFENLHNSGRLVLISQDETRPLEKGVLDDDIYFETVGETRPTLAQAREDKIKRFAEATFCELPVYVDQTAFQKFVAQDFSLALTCLNQTALRMQRNFDFRFLRYGAGLFAMQLQPNAFIEKNLLCGIAQGLEWFLSNTLPAERNIKVLSLPFYSDITPEAKALQDICTKQNITCRIPKEDALMPSPEKDLMVATTNMSNSHNVTAAESPYSSVCSSIGLNTENLQKFYPVLNRDMREEYVTPYSIPELNKILAAAMTNTSERDTTRIVLEFLGFEPGRIAAPPPEKTTVPTTKAPPPDKAKDDQSNNPAAPPKEDTTALKSTTYKF